MSDGFKMSLKLAMPESRPEEAPLCDGCSMKHATHDECWEGILPAGMLPLPTFDKNMTGRELIDEGMPKVAKNVKVIKKSKKEKPDGA